MKKLLILLLTLSVAFTLGACCLKHEWNDATCTEPKTCARCGETEGEALGHEWTDATCTEPKTCARCGETEGEALGHEWADATCTAPKTCARCGETEGEPLGHTAGEASCTEDPVCSVCGETLESASGHNWTDATLDTPKTCVRCGETEGDVLSPFTYIERDGKAIITGYQGNCPSELVIPDEIDGLEVAGIADNAFADRAELVSVTFPESVADIGANAFAGCSQLATVNIPNFDETQIDHTAFENCGELTGVMGDEIFYTGYTKNCGDMEGEWEGSRGTCFHGVYTDVYHLDEPISNCVGFSLDTAITQYNGNPFREWEIYVKRGSKAWEKVAEYTMSREKAGETEQFTFEFEKPISFDSIAIADKNNYYHTVYYTVYLHDVVRYIPIDTDTK